MTTTGTLTSTLRLGTRASALARTQSQAVADAITAATGTPVELVPIVTEGDRSSAAIAQLGGTGVFVAAIRRALLEGSIDVAVHSEELRVVPPELARGQLRGPDPPRRQLPGDHFEDLLVAQAAALELAVPAPDEVLHRLGEVPHDLGHHPRRLTGAQRRAASRSTPSIASMFFR